ncbi:MAG TPA: RNA-binding S4 domain-containing protein [Crocinitomicaceae bacterium]|nr:RNA-binding S4 domain-containing protein [Crocinitomicaceae bacterium]
MKEINFKIEGDFIELVQLLKAVGLAQTGGHAKIIVNEEMVKRNGVLETRKRAKLLPHEIIEVENFKIVLE